MEAERSYTEQIQKIRKATRKDLDSPPGPPSEISGKQSDAGTFCYRSDTENMMWKNYIGTAQSDEYSKVNETNDDINIYLFLVNYIGTAYRFIISFQGLNVDLASLKRGNILSEKRA